MKRRKLWSRRLGGRGWMCIMMRRLKGIHVFQKALDILKRKRLDYSLK